MIVKHPAFPHITRDVPDADAPRWVTQGWIAPKPKKSAPKTSEAATAADQGQHSDEGQES